MWIKSEGMMREDIVSSATTSLRLVNMGGLRSRESNTNVGFLNDFRTDSRASDYWVRSRECRNGFDRERNGCKSSELWMNSAMRFRKAGAFDAARLVVIVSPHAKRSDLTASGRLGSSKC